MTEAAELRQRYDRALARAAAGVRARSRIVGLGLASGAALATLALAVARGFPAAGPDPLAAAACAGAAAFLVSQRRPGPSASAARLDRLLGTEVFGAAHAGRGSLEPLCLREALAALAGRDPARLTRGDLTAALAGPLAGLALLLLAPLAVVSQESEAPAARGLAAAARAGSLASASAPTAEARSAGASLARAASSALAAPARERASAEATAREQAERLLSALGAPPAPAERGVPLEVLAERAAALLEPAPRGGELAARGMGPGSEGGGAAASMPAPGPPGTLPDPAAAEAAGGALAAPAWPARYDEVVRRYFELAASAATKPKETNR